MNFGGQEMIVVLVIVLLLFGGQKIPELMRGIGKGMGELQRGLEESKRMLQEEIKLTPVQRTMQHGSIAETFDQAS